MKKWNLIIAGISVIIGIIILYLTKDFPTTVAKAPGPGLWPNLLGSALIGLAVILGVGVIVGKNQSDSKIELKTPAVNRVYQLMGITVVFSIILYFLGFVIAALLFIGAVMYLLEVRSLKLMMLSSVLITASIYIVFAMILHTPLPNPIFLR